MGTHVRRRARLVYRVTDDLKQRMLEDLQSRLQQMSSAVAAVESALEVSAESQRAGLIARREQLLRSRDEVSARAAQVQGLQAGAEVSEGSVEIVSTVEVGDPEERLKDAQIVICDGRIVEIRSL